MIMFIFFIIHRNLVMGSTQPIRHPYALLAKKTVGLERW